MILQFFTKNPSNVASRYRPRPGIVTRFVDHECRKGDSNSGRAVRRQPICQAAFNGESGNNGDASVHADGAKSRCPKRVAGALRRRNSLRTAIQTWGGVCPGYQYRDCCPHSAHTEQSGETAPLTFPSQLSQIYRPNSAQREQSGETALLISLSQRFRFRFVTRPNVGRVTRHALPLIALSQRKEDFPAWRRRDYLSQAHRRGNQNQPKTAFDRSERGRQRLGARGLQFLVDHAVFCNFSNRNFSLGNARYLFVKQKDF